MTFISSNSHELFDVGQALDAAIHGTPAKGYTGEILAELAHKKGDGAVHIPLVAALAVAKATGAGPLAGYGSAVPLTGFSTDSVVTDVAPAIREELIATRAGVRMISTLEAQHRLPIVNARPVAAVYDVDEAVTPGADSGFNTVLVEPIVIACQTAVANSLSFARSVDATAITIRHLTEAIVDETDRAIVGGYGPTTSGRSWGGFAGASTASGVALGAGSTISDWRDVQHSLMSYLRMSEMPGARWVAAPEVASMLMASPVFAGAQMPIATSANLTELAGSPWVNARLPITAGVTDIYYGMFDSIVAVAFSGATISLLANPYEVDAFARGTTLLRAIAGLGVAVTDPGRIVRASVTL